MTDINMERTQKTKEYYVQSRTETINKQKLCTETQAQYKLKDYTNNQITQQTTYLNKIDK